VVDDDSDVREGLKALLATVGLRTLAFGSTAEFLRSKPAHEVGCLILDVRLPGRGGLDFQAELAAAKVNIPIIFLTGYADIPMSVQAMKGGAVEFLTKPFREQDILDAVRVALDRDRTGWEQETKIRETRLRFNALSPREQDVMKLVTAGLMNKQVAAQLDLSEVTVKFHRHKVMQKLGAKSFADLVRIADSLGIARGRPPVSES
jgi:FixJ family two-component response regulator